MRILHTSDWHGHHRHLLEVLDTQEYDVWVDTGDFQPNPGWGNPIKRIPQIQAQQQRKWWSYKGLAKRIDDVLRGRPKVLIPGNHDFYNHAIMLAQRQENTYAPGLDPVSIGGVRFCGIAEIPYIAGHWARETTSRGLEALVEAIPDCDVLLSHAPPAGHLSYRDEWGIPGLEKTHAKHILCGHVHECGGMKKQVGDTMVYNSATTFQLVDIED